MCSCCSIISSYRLCHNYKSTVKLSWLPHYLLSGWSVVQWAQKWAAFAFSKAVIMLGRSHKCFAEVVNKATISLPLTQPLPFSYHWANTLLLSHVSCYQYHYCKGQYFQYTDIVISHCSSKTPGGRLVYLYTKKRGSVPKCGDCGSKLRGVSLHWSLFLEWRAAANLCCHKLLESNAMKNDWLVRLDWSVELAEFPSHCLLNGFSLVVEHIILLLYVHPLPLWYSSSQQ